MASTGLRISIASQCARSYKETIFAGNSKSTLTNSFRPFQPPPQRPTVLCFSSRRRQRAIPSVSSKTFKKKVRKENVGEDEDAVDALFRKVEEVLKNGDDDISGEELEKFEQELAEALTDDELFGALESLARGETKNGKEEEEEEDDDEGEGEDDMSDEELEKLVQELSEVLEDDELFEEMESIVRGESKGDDDDDDDDNDDKLAKLKRVVKEKEEELAKLEQELVESLAEEDDDDEDELAKLEQEMAEALAQDEEDDDDEEEEEEEVEVVKVEAEIVEDDDDEDNDISEEKLVELVEELSEALKDGEMLINFRVHLDGGK